MEPRITIDPASTVPSPARDEILVAEARGTGARI